MSSALFHRFPGLRDRLPWIPIASLPTPLEELPRPDGFRGRLFVKRDDLTSSLYGGNKVRKFEPLFADARQRGAHALVTVGSIGSNQALAAALHGRALGFAVELSLVRQPVTDAVKRNLSGMRAAGARIRYASGWAGGFLNAAAAVRAGRRRGEHPYYIPLGATNGLSSAAYVAAALELAEQIRQGACPPPDRIFVAAGTGGTAAGLCVGCRIAGLDAPVSAVRVTARRYMHLPLLVWHARRVAELLRGLDSAIPRLHIGQRDFVLIGGFSGAGYGAPTPSGRAALAWAAPRLQLDSTYTGKALAACLAACGPAAGNETILFWNTYNSAPFATADSLDALPAPLTALLAGT